MTRVHLVIYSALEGLEAELKRLITTKSTLRIRPEVLKEDRNKLAAFFRGRGIAWEEGNLEPIHVICHFDPHAELVEVVAEVYKQDVDAEVRKRKEEIASLAAGRATTAAPSGDVTFSGLKSDLTDPGKISFFILLYQFVAAHRFSSMLFRVHLFYVAQPSTAAAIDADPTYPVADGIATPGATFATPQQKPTTSRVSALAMSLGQSLNMKLPGTDSKAMAGMHSTRASAAQSTAKTLFKEDEGEFICNFFVLYLPS